MKVLISGASGFIGSHLLKALGDKYEKHAILRYVTGRNIPDNDVTKHFVNLTDYFAVRKVIKEVKPDAVIHLAALSSVGYSYEHPQEVIETNFLGSVNLAEACMRELPNLERIIVSSTCYDDQTRAYTKDGLKTYSELKVGDTVLSLNMETGNIEEDTVTNVNIQSYIGDMIKFHRRGVDLLVTPNHKMVIRNGSGKILFEAAEITKDRSIFSIPLGKWIGDEVSNDIDIDSEIYDLSSLMYFIGLFIGDGFISSGYDRVIKSGLDRASYLSVCRDDNGKFTSPLNNSKCVHYDGDRVYLCIPDTDKSIKKIKDTLDILGLSYNRHGTQIYLNSNKRLSPLISILKECGHGARNKHIPPSLLNYSPKYLNCIIMGLLDSDGYKKCITTSSKRLSEQLIEICHKTGRNVKISKHHNSSVLNGRSITGDAYYIYMTEHEHRLIDTCNSIIPYNGTIWCPTIKNNHNLLVERNGCVCFSGNSETYGNHPDTDFPLTEGSEQYPNSPYSASKKSMEDYMKYMYLAYDFPVVITRPFNCYDDKTEILTHRGWKLFKDLEIGEDVATLSKDGYLEFQKPYDYTIKPYSGKMIHVKGSQLDLLVTPNHRMFVRKRYESEYGIMEASELLNYRGKRGVVFKHSAKTVPELCPVEGVYCKWFDPTWIKFIAWWLSEGCIDRRKGHHEIDIRQCNLDNLREIHDIVVKLGYTPHETWIKQERVRFSDKDLHEYLSQFGKSGDKFVPEEIKKLPKDLIQLFIDTYQRGDGSRGSFNGYEVRDCIVSKSKKMLDDLQELCIRVGWSGSIKGTHLTIARTRTETCPRTEDNFTEEEYDGTIYCVSVPNEILLVRRNGKVVFCGNTYGRKLDKSFMIERCISQMVENPYGIVCLGDPYPVRDWMYVDDHVNAYIKLLECQKECIYGDVFQFCTGKSYTVKDTAEIIGKAVGFEGDIIWGSVPKRPYDIMKLEGSYSKSQKILGWEPTVTFSQGVKKIAEYWSEK